MPRDITDEQEEEDVLAIARYFTYLIKDCGYHSPVLLPGNRYACIMPLLFTHAIIVGPIGDMTGYSDRWCFAGREKAERALADWDGTGEPDGWHRHPNTGRRRDPETGDEWIDP